MGRKTTFDQGVADKICAKLSEGIPLAEICRAEGMPPVRTVSGWKEANPAFAADFARAREEGYDAIAQRTRETARGRGDSDGNVLRDRLIIDTDLKLLAKWFPARYGDKMVVAGDPSAPLGAPSVSQDVLATLATMTPEQLRAMATKPLRDE